ncbi:MAG: Wzz/FepE/Etk N-terminal domain-containing protein [Chloroflexota bacterium]
MNSEPVQENIYEIDLHAILKVLWNSRITIILSTILPALAAYIISFWFIPKTYQAEALLHIGPPVFVMTNTANFMIAPTPPDLNTVVQLSMDKDLLESVGNDPAILANNGNKKVNLADMAVAEIGTNNQISLKINDSDAMRASLIANIWAEKAAKRVNDQFGVNGYSMVIENQLPVSLLSVEQAQKELEKVIADSSSEKLNALVINKTTELNCILDGLTQTTRILADLSNLEQKFSKIPDDSIITFGDEIEIATIQQRSMVDQGCSSTTGKITPGYAVRIDNLSIIGITISLAKDGLAQIQKGLENKKSLLINDQARLEKEIPILKKELENSQNLIYYANIKRDQSRDFYSQLLMKQRQLSPLLTLESAMVARINLQAQTPKSSSSPRYKLITAFAGVLGLFLSSLFFLAINWWKLEENS